MLLEHKIYMKIIYVHICIYICMYYVCHYFTNSLKQSKLFIVLIYSEVCCCVLWIKETNDSMKDKTTIVQSLYYKLLYFPSFQGSWRISYHLYFATQVEGIKSQHHIIWVLALSADPNQFSVLFISCHRQKQYWMTLPTYFEFHA